MDNDTIVEHKHHWETNRRVKIHAPVNNNKPSIMLNKSDNINVYMHIAAKIDVYQNSGTEIYSDSKTDTKGGSLSLSLNLMSKP